jgi:hypothetical protein
LVVVSNSLWILLMNVLKVANTSLLSTRKNTYVYLVKSSTITNPYLFPPILVYVVGPNKSMCYNSNALDALFILFLGCVLPTCFLAWHALQSLSFSNMTSFKPLTRSRLINMFSCFISTWWSLLCHNQPMLNLVSKHVDNWASLCHGTIQIIRAQVQKQSPKWSNSHTWAHITPVV